MKSSRSVPHSDGSWPASPNTRACTGTAKTWNSVKSGPGPISTTSVLMPETVQIT
jgi:hypothetical protein